MSQIDELNYYHLLEIPKDATLDQIKKAYRRLALQHHPDKGGDENYFKQISEAYQILSDTNLRAQYDQSQPLPQIELIPALNVFHECFRQWLSQFPMIEFLFQDSCQDVIQLFNQHAENPMVKLLINTLTDPSNSLKPDYNILSQLSHNLVTTALNKMYSPKTHQDNIILFKKVYITLDDIYVGKRYPHQFIVTNEDLQLSGDYNIINPTILINIPVQHTSLEIETDLQIVNSKQNTSYIQKTTIQLDIIINTHDNFYRIREYDLLMYIDLPLITLQNQDTITVPYLNHHIIQLKNPKNANLRQLYQIENVALPNKNEKKRGNLYILFNLILHADQINSVLPITTTSGIIYDLIPIQTEYLFGTDLIPQSSIQLLSFTNTNQQPD